MTPQTLAITITTIVVASIAQALLKNGMIRAGGFSSPGIQFLESLKNILLEPYIVAGFLLVAIVVPMWLIVLERLPLSVASPLVSVGYIVALVIGGIFFKETMTPLKIGGVGLIILGVIAVAKSQ